jgi:hypothetical protein
MSPAQLDGRPTPCPFWTRPLTRVGLFSLTTVVACIRRLTIAAWLGMVAQRVCTPIPFIPASGIDGESLPRGMCISSIHQEGQEFPPVSEQPVVIPDGMPFIPRRCSTVSKERIAQLNRRPLLPCPVATLTPSHCGTGPMTGMPSGVRARRPARIDWSVAFANCGIASKIRVERSRNPVSDGLLLSPA